jgi:hypothetical protein
MSESEYLSILDEQVPKRKMSFLKKLLIVSGLLCCIPGLLFAFFIYGLATSEIQREIGGPITISSNWVEITPDKPMKPSHQTQYVILEVSDAHTSYTTPYDPNDKSWDQSWAMRFPDGSLVRPEVQIVDEYGKVYDLKSPSFTHKDRTKGDAMGGMGFTRSFDPSIDSNLPKDRVYRTVRIRSDRPIHCSRIIWECRTGK